MGIAPSGYKHRLIEKDLEDSLRVFGGVSIEGPMWCGKTWLGLNASESSFEIGSTDEYGQDNRDLVSMNVRLAMDGKQPHLIDEWQEVPKIWDAVRFDIDHNPGKGKYILTGSSVPKIEKPMHCGAGRIKRCRMRTMSLFESGDSTGEVSLKDIICGIAGFYSGSGIDLERLVDLTMAGGWPGTLGLSYSERAESVKTYLESFIAKASVLEGIYRKDQNLLTVFRSLARNESTVAEVTKIHNDTGVPIDRSLLMLDTKVPADKTPLSYDTVSSYIDVFDRLYLIEDQPAFDPHLRSSIKVGKRVKRHLTDPSLGIAALNIGKERLMKDLRTYGFFFEAMCERDLSIYAHSFGAEQYHYRDDSGTEVDSVIEMADGRWAAIEIKLSADRVDEGAGSLLKFRKKMEKHNAGSLPCALCVVCGLANHAYLRDDGVYVVPITMLRP